jgi:hypothetical protein
MYMNSYFCSYKYLTTLGEYYNKKWKGYIYMKNVPLLKSVTEKIMSGDAQYTVHHCILNKLGKTKKSLFPRTLLTKIVS